MSSPLRILVADDEPDMRRYFCKILPRLGHTVLAVAENGQQLVEHCRQLHPDLVITDLRMPELDGHAAIQEIYRHGLLPILLISAHCSPQLAEQAMRNHILVCLTKPFKQAELAAAIRRVMQDFGEFQLVLQQTTSVAQALEDHGRVRLAKQLLADELHLSPPAAFCELLHRSREQELPLAQLAQQLLGQSKLPPNG